MQPTETSILSAFNSLVDLMMSEPIAGVSPEVSAACVLNHVRRCKNKTDLTSIIKFKCRNDDKTDRFIIDDEDDPKLAMVTGHCQCEFSVAWTEYKHLSVWPHRLHLSFDLQVAMPACILCLETKKTACWLKNFFFYPFIVLNVLPGDLYERALLKRKRESTGDSSKRPKKHSRKVRSTDVELII